MKTYGFTIINKEKCTFSEGVLVTEASDIELLPGEWPDMISVIDDDGEGFIFHRSNAIDANGEFGGYNYYTRGTGHKLVVFND
jgi:hypothetical protein